MKAGVQLFSIRGYLLVATPASFFALNITAGKNVARAADLVFFKRPGVENPLLAVGGPKGLYDRENFVAIIIKDESCAWDLEKVCARSGSGQLHIYATRMPYFDGGYDLSWVRTPILVFAGALILLYNFRRTFRKQAAPVDENINGILQRFLQDSQLQ